MAKQIGLSRLKSGELLLKRSLGVSLLAGLGVISSSIAAQAHHPFGGQTPATFLEGFLSGLGHPVIGIDHLVFVIAVGLTAAILRQGIWVPLAFVGTALVGTGVHLQSWNLPAPEVFISASILLFGGLLALRHSPNPWLAAGSAAVAGLFHGYAYGEAVVGAEMAPLLAYLIGFSVIQLMIAASAYRCGRAFNPIPSEPSILPLRFAGFAIAGMGLAFLSSVLLG
nr:HupE/UreJ family protein [Acaryochloris sp. IP29b_bin.148]